MIDILLKSLMAGCVVGLVLIVAKVVGPKYAGLISGLPLIIPISYVLLTMNDKAVGEDVLMGGVFGALSSAFFAGFLILLNHKFTDFYWINFGMAYLACVGCAASVTFFLMR